MIRDKLLSHYHPSNTWYRAILVCMMIYMSFDRESMAPILWYSGIDAALRVYAFNYHDDVEIYMLPWWVLGLAMVWLGAGSEDSPTPARATPSAPPATPSPQVKYVERIVEKVVEKPVHVVKTKGEIRQFKAGFGIGNCATCANWFGPREQQMGTDMIFADPRALGRCSVFKNRRIASTTCDSYESAL